MLKVVQSVCNDANVAITSIAALNNAYTRLNSKIGEIDVTAQGQIIDTSGLTKEKDTVKEKLSGATGKIAQAIMAYAHDNEVYALEKEVQFTAKKLNRVSDELLIKISTNILNAATPLVGVLADYTVDTPTLENFENLKTDFEKISPKVPEARNKKKMYTARLEKLVHEADDILKNDMDRLVNILDETHADFMILYKHARVTDEYHVHRQKPEPVPGT